MAEHYFVVYRQPIYFIHSFCHPIASIIIDTAIIHVSLQVFLSYYDLISYIYIYEVKYNSEIIYLYISYIYTYEKWNSRVLLNVFLIFRGTFLLLFMLVVVICILFNITYGMTLLHILISIFVFFITAILTRDVTSSWLLRLDIFHIQLAIYTFVS